jgi:ABC-2 type transport system permease protein
MLVVMLMLGVIPTTEKFNPITLASKNMNLISGTQEPGGLMITILVTAVLTVLCIGLSISIFKKKKL